MEPTRARGPAGLTDGVGDRPSVEDGKERVRGVTQGAFEPAGRRQRTRARHLSIEALDERERPFGPADDFADRDLIRCERQAEPAVPSAHGVEIAELLQRMHDLDDVVA